MVVHSDVLTFNHHITVQLHFFSGDTATVNHSICHSRLTHRQSLHLVQSLAFVSYSQIKNILRQLHEIFVLGYKVRFTLQSDNRTETILSLYQHTAFCSLAV